MISSKGSTIRAILEAERALTVEELKLVEEILDEIRPIRDTDLKIGYSFPLERRQELRNVLRAGYQHTRKTGRVALEAARKAVVVYLVNPTTTPKRLSKQEIIKYMLPRPKEIPSRKKETGRFANLSEPASTAAIRVSSRYCEKGRSYCRQKGLKVNHSIIAGYYQQQFIDFVRKYSGNDDEAIAAGRAFVDMIEIKDVCEAILRGEITLNFAKQEAPCLSENPKNDAKQLLREYFRRKRLECYNVSLPSSRSKNEAALRATLNARLATDIEKQKLDEKNYSPAAFAELLYRMSFLPQLPKKDDQD